MADQTPGEEENWEPAVIVPLAELDRRYLGYSLCSSLGELQGGRTSLIAAGVQITEALLERLHANAERLGEEGAKLDYVRLVRSIRSKPIEPEAALTPAKRQEVFAGLAVSFDSVREVFAKEVGSFESTVFRENEEELRRKIRSYRLELPPEFRQTLLRVVGDILSERNRATLFGCLEQFRGDTSDHCLRVFLMGTKLLARVLHVTADKFRGNRRLMDYAFGLLFHDVGMLFVPEEIYKKTLRLSEAELTKIRGALRLRGLDPNILTTIQAVNDPRFVYKKSVEKSLVREVTGMHYLVEAEVISEDQYRTLITFPDRSCLSPYERALLERHPQWGWEVVAGSGFSSPYALDIVRHHHQRRDRTGYPDIQQDMTLAAQAAALVDVFDALVSERVYTNTKPYDVAFGILDAMTNPEPGTAPELDRKLYDEFCACVQKYPVGSFVRLSGGRYHGCVGQVCCYSAYAMNTPSLVLVRDDRGRWLDHLLRLDRADYDGSFRIQGLPFTENVCRQILHPRTETEGNQT